MGVEHPIDIDAVPATPAKVAAILVSKFKAPPEEIESSAPKGYRLATTYEIILAYRYDPSFREKLKGKGSVCTATKGLGLQGRYKITDDGQLLKVPSYEEYIQLQECQRVFCSSGTNANYVLAEYREGQPNELFLCSFYLSQTSPPLLLSLIAVDGTKLYTKKDNSIQEPNNQAGTKNILRRWWQPPMMKVRTENNPQ